MKLADLLAQISPEHLERLAHQHARADDLHSRAQLLDATESVLRSYRFLQEFFLNRQPPAFAMCTLLLDAPGLALPTAGFRELVIAETQRICERLDAGALLRRDDQLRIYRRVLYMARSNDRLIDDSEAAILGVLRQELDVAMVEHFLIEHHRDLREFWDQTPSFVRELHELRSAGLVFVRDGYTLLPEDLAGVVRQVLGIDMTRDAARRVYAHFQGPELHESLQSVGAPTSGSKDERIERLVAHWAQPRVMLRHLGVDRLRAICKDIGARVSGAKDELADRIVSHVASGRDISREADPPQFVQEPLRLTRERFDLLFAHLRIHELAAILGQFDQRRWGAKSLQLTTLWESGRSEATSLACLSNPELDTLLERVGLKRGGTKADRIERLIERFKNEEISALREFNRPGESDGEPQP